MTDGVTIFVVILLLAGLLWATLVWVGRSMRR